MTQVQEALAFEVHYSILQESGTLARKVHVLRGKSVEDVRDTLRRSLETDGVDMRKVNIYKVDEIKPGDPPKGNELGVMFIDDPPQPEDRAKAEKPKTNETKQPKPETERPKAETEKPFNNRVMTFVCDVKQNVITNKDGVRVLKLMLEVCGSQVNDVQIGMLKYRPQESLKITCEPIQADLLDDKNKKPEKQMELDDATRNRKVEEKKESEAKQAKEKKSDSQEQPKDQPAAEKVSLPSQALSHGYDSEGNEYFFDRNTRQFFKVSKAGEVEKVEQPPEPLKAKRK